MPIDAIVLSKISKRYVISHKFGVKIVEPLKNLDLNIQGGEVLGIMGKNGSGKSTLLKIIAGIVKPSSGKIETVGSIASLIDISAGFIMDLDIYNNIDLQLNLYSQLLAKHYSREALAQKIVDLAELNAFTHQPLFTFSSGMLLRLAFAITTVLDADIYLYDELISVGDQSFRVKTASFFRKLKKQNKTIVIASHDMGMLLNYCDSIVVLENGAVKSYPSLEELKFYFESQQRQRRLKVITNSMHPTIKMGDWVNFVPIVNKEIRTGDIVVFKLEKYPIPIVHRVFGIVKTAAIKKGYLTKGDNNDTFDHWLVEDKQILGVVK